MCKHIYICIPLKPLKRFCIFPIITYIQFCTQISLLILCQCALFHYHIVVTDAFFTNTVDK